jgi:integrase
MAVRRIKKRWYVDTYIDGRRIRRVAGDKKSEAIAAEEAIKTDHRRGEYKFKRESKILFEVLAKDYIEYAEANKKSWKRDVASLKNLNPFFKGIRISKITPRHIEDYKIMRVEQVAPSTVNRELSLLKFMYTLAIKWKMADENPVKGVKLFQERRLVWPILDREMADRLIKYAAPHLKPIIIIGLHTGMRKGEILNLQWNDVDFGMHHIFVRESKSGKGRKIPMNHIVAATLKSLKRESKFLFFNPDTKEALKDIKRAFKTARRKASITDFRFHDLRHTAATNMVNGGVDIVTVKEILGHQSIEMTMRYAHPTPENKRKAVDVLAAVFGEKPLESDKTCMMEEKEIIATDLITSN